MRLALSIHFVAFTARVRGEILFMPRFMEDANLGRRISLSRFFSLFFFCWSLRIQFQGNSPKNDMLDELEKPQQSLKKKAVSLIATFLLTSSLSSSFLKLPSVRRGSMEVAANRLIQSEREGGGAFERQFTEFIPEPQASKIGINLYVLLSYLINLRASKSLKRRI